MISLAKRLEEAVREERLAEDTADAVLALRVEIWSGRQDNGQMLLFSDTRQNQ